MTSRKGKGGGRRSRAEIDLQAEAGTQLLVVQRLSPPLSLTGAGEDLWRAMVQAMPDDWLDEASAPLLEAYITHCVRARTAAAELEAFEAARRLEIEQAPEGTYPECNSMEWSRLTTIYRRETGALANLASKLRISPSSKYSAEWRPSRGGKGSRKKPWEFDG